MSNVNEPIPVARPEPRTVLESAMLALESNSSKSVHLSPRQAEVVLIHIGNLRRKIERYEGTISYVADRLSEFEDAEPPQWEGCP